MIISVTGYGYSGATAVVDFLHGYSSMKIYDEIEFQLIHQADGLLDLKYHLVDNPERIACNTAINRFLNLQKKGVFASRIKQKIGNQYDSLVNDYINSLVQVSWKGRSNYDPPDITRDSHIVFFRKCQSLINYLSKKLGLDFHFPPLKARFFSFLTEDEFDEKTRLFLSSFLELLNIRSEDDAVLEMLFSPTRPKLGTEFFNNVKNIIVCREPRDIFLYGKQTQLSHSFMPWDTVESFVVYYKSLYEHSYASESELIVQYEDLIYKYESTTQKIIDYLGYTSRPESEFQFFDPDISVKYTNLKRDNQRFKKEIEYIETNLSTYLYDFPDCYIPRIKNID